MSKEFDLEKNQGKTPADYFAGSSARVWWKCNKGGHSWKVAISSRTDSRGTKGCLQCGMSGTSKIEEKIRKSISDDSVILNIEDAHNSVVSVRWRNRSTQRVDVLGNYQNHKFVCEFDGWYWHSGIRNNDKTASVARDLAKTIALLESNFIVVRIREISGNNALELLDITHPLLLQINWKRPKDDDTTELKNHIYKWLFSIQQFI